MQDPTNRSAAGPGSAVSFSDDEDTTQISGSRSSARGRRGSSRSSRDAYELGKSRTSARGRGRGRATSNLKQSTLDAALGFCRSERSLLALNFDDLNTGLHVIWSYSFLSIMLFSLPLPFWPSLDHGRL